MDELEVRKKKLLENLKRKGYLKTDEVYQAMLSIAREDFVPQDSKQYAYADTPLDIGQGQTISAPHMVAMMCERLELKKGMNVLEIGSGCGYHAAVMAMLVGEEGHVYSVEIVQELADRARRNIAKAGLGRNVTVVETDGSIGLESFAPYDRIYYACGAPSLPEHIYSQLKDEGILVVPIGATYCQKLMLCKKKNGAVVCQDEGGCAFVPLVGEKGVHR